MHSFNKASLLGLIAALGLAAASAAGAAPSPNPAPSSKWVGVWTHVGSINFDPTIPGSRTDDPPYNAEYKKKWEEIQAAEKEGRAINDRSADCQPPGLVRMMNMAYPMEILDGPGQVTIIGEWEGQIRRIYTDGRHHPEDPDPTYQGHSIGHWEGNVLVVDTVGLLGEGIINDHGAPLGKQVHVSERIWAQDPDTLKFEFTVESPDALTRPITATKTLKRRKDLEILEYVCTQNNRNPTNASGVTTVTLK